MGFYLHGAGISGNGSGDSDIGVCVMRESRSHAKIQANDMAGGRDESLTLTLTLTLTE